MTTEQRSWVVPVDEEGVITFPDDLLDQLGWKEGDVIDFDAKPDGTIVLTKVNDEPQVNP